MQELPTATPRARTAATWPSPPLPTVASYLEEPCEPRCAACSAEADGRCSTCEDEDGRGRPLCDTCARDPDAHGERRCFP
jgi:hypothetical protein